MSIYLFAFICAHGNHMRRATTCLWIIAFANETAHGKHGLPFLYSCLNSLHISENMFGGGVIFITCKVDLNMQRLETGLINIKLQFQNLHLNDITETRTPKFQNNITGTMHSSIPAVL